MSDSPKHSFSGKLRKDFSFEDKREESDKNFDPYLGPSEEDDKIIGKTADKIHIAAKEMKIPQNVIYDLAEKSLPKTPEIKKVLDYGSGLDFGSLLTAISLQEQFKGKLPMQKLDRLSAAALLVGTENIDDIYDLFKPETAAMADEFMSMLLQDDSAEKIRDVHAFSPDTRRIFFCSILADLALSSRKIADGEQAHYAESDLADLADIVSQASKNCTIDGHLLANTVKAYNGVSEIHGFATRLSLNVDGSADIIRKKDPPALRIRPPRP